MNSEESVALVNSQVACAMIEAMGMQAENRQREYLGQSMAFQEDAFLNIITRYGIDHNSILMTLK